uniref:Uncharacterized protein n=1 Tax=Ciona savignyi TaxID=51511 RepID=H2YKM5_CIOSA
MTDCLIYDPLSDQKPTTKSSKRNKQRKQAKKKLKCGDSPEPTHVDENTLEGLRHQMELAKTQEDHVLMNKLRQKIWLLQDASAGIKSNVSKDQLETIFQDTTNKPITKTITIERAADGEVPTLEETQHEILQRKMRKLQKKKQDIEKLKQRFGNGEKLEKTQLLKIEREKQLDEEIDDLEDEIFELKRRG